MRRPVGEYFAMYGLPLTRLRMARPWRAATSKRRLEAQISRSILTVVSESGLIRPARVMPPVGLANPTQDG